MKQKILSRCMALFLAVAMVLGMLSSVPAKAEGEPPISFEVQGADGAEHSGAWNVTTGQEEDSTGATVKYIQFPGQYSNGRWIVNFPTAGIYKMQMVMAVPTLTKNIHLEWAPAGTDSFTVVNGNIGGITQTGENEYRVFDGPELNVEEAGEYDLKFGSWVAGADFKLNRFIFTCENPIAPPDPNVPLVLQKGSELPVKEALAFHKNGSLKTEPQSGSYVDYLISVEETGDYTLAYSIAANEGEVLDAFQVSFAEKKEETLTNEDFTIKLAPVQITHYYSAVVEKQSVHLEAGTYVMRTKALNEGFSLTQITLYENQRHILPEEGILVIPAAQFHNGTNYHAVENGGANIGYAASGLGLDYEISVSKAGIYRIRYNYASAGEYSLTTQRLTDGIWTNLGTSALSSTEEGSANWYAKYVESEAVPLLLPAGTYDLRIYWNSNDINLRSFTLEYGGEAVDYVKELLEGLPEITELALSDKEAVEIAKNSYQVLTEEEKLQIDSELTEKLTRTLERMEALELEWAKEEDLASLEKEFVRYQQEDYHEAQWMELLTAKEQGEANIRNAVSREESRKALKETREAMAAVVKKLKALALTENNSVILTQKKAYRKKGSMNSAVQRGNYADYYLNVKERGEYTFTCALYSEQPVEAAVLIKHSAEEYPEEVKDVYGTLNVPRAAEEGTRVKEIRKTVFLEAGEQTLRLEANSDQVRLNRVVIQKKQEKSLEISQAGEVQILNAADCTEGFGQYVLENGIVTDTAKGACLDYAVSVKQKTDCQVSYTYAYTGANKPELTLSMVDAEGAEKALALTGLTSVKDGFGESAKTQVSLPAGTYTLRVSMKTEGVDLKAISIGIKTQEISLEGIWLNARRVILDRGATFQLSAALKPENAPCKVTWSSDKEEVAKVTPEGLIVAGKSGSAVVTAEANGKKAQCRVTVTGASEQQPQTPEKKPSFLSRTQVTLGRRVLYAGGNAQNSTKVETVIPTGASLARIEYASGNPKVAKISGKGKITARRKGKAVITVKITLTNGESASVQKTVTVKRACLKLKKARPSVKVGKSVNLRMKVVGSSKRVTYRLANKKDKKTGIVTKNGKFTGKAKGSVKVTAKAGKLKKTFKVVVK